VHRADLGQTETAQASGGDPFFKPIEATDGDDVILPESYKYGAVRKWVDAMQKEARNRP
jgi:hypothetical protein